MRKHYRYHISRCIFIERKACLRSYLNENKEEESHNERLEFLGDAVLELIYKYLYLNFEKMKGQIFVSSIVKDTLAEVGRDIGIGDFYYSKGEKELLEDQIKIIF